jgi:ribosome-associated translation inhibitor RaiA
MSAHYFFQDFNRVNHLESFLSEKIQSVVDRFIPDGRYDLTMRVQTISARKEHKKPNFLCEIRLDSPQSPISIIVKKQGANFYRAAFQVAQALKTILRRQSSRRTHYERRDHNHLERQQQQPPPTQLNSDEQDL